MDALTDKLSGFAAMLAYDSLPTTLIDAARQRLIDTLGCALGGRACDAARIARGLGEGTLPVRWQGRVLSYPARTTAESAAFVNGIMARYLDFNDTGPGSHPSDSIGGLVAIAEAAGADGRRLLSAIIVAYEILIRLAFGTAMRQKGWDQGFVTAVGTAAGAGHLLRLPRDQIAHAIAIAAVANVPLRASRAGQLSLWKAAATPFAVKNGIVAALLAADGMTGPEQPFEGRFGLWEQITGPFEIEPFSTAGGNALLPRWSRLKYWPVEYNAQIAVWAARELRTRLPVDQIASITIHTYHQAWHEIGSEPAKWDPRTRETADHSLPYIFARTLVDGAITVASFDAAAYLDASLRPLMAKIAVCADATLSAQFPAAIPIRVEAVAQSGERITVALANPKGHDQNPMNEADVDAKFCALAEPVLGRRQTTAALAAWRNIDTQSTLGAALDLLIPAGR